MSSMFLRGADAAATEAAKVGGGNFGTRLPFFNIKDGETVYVRWLTDFDAVPGADVESWIVVQMHSNVPTKPQPQGWTGNWPRNISAVCRRTGVPTGVANQTRPLYDDCYICDHMKVKDAKTGGEKPFTRTVRPWALAVMREPVYENGTLVGFKDQTRTTMRDGVQVEDKAYVLVNQGQRNFFGTLEGIARHWGTALDRDYKITRRGASTDTDYTFVHMDPISFVSADGTEKRFDLRDPECMAKYPHGISLEEEVLRRCSEEYYGLFFDPNVVPAWESRGQGETAQSQPSVPKPEGDVNPEHLANLAARVTGYSTESQTPSTPSGRAY